MNLANTIPIFIAGVFALSMINHLVGVAPISYFIINVVLVRIENSTLGHTGFYHRLNRLLLHIRQNTQANQATAFDQAKDWILFISTRATTSFSL